MLVALSAPHSVVAASHRSAALPAGSHVVASLSLGTGTRAVIYIAGNAYVGVLDRHGTGEALAWHRSLPFAAASLFAGGAPGSFAGFGRQPGGSEHEFFAFRLAGNRVHPAVEGSTSGIVLAGESAHASGGEVLLRSHDDAHAGSVSYALVTHYRWESTRYVPAATTLRPDYPATALPHPRGVVKTRHGDTILIRLEVAETEQERETGLMNRTSLDPDSGMIFVWPSPVLESFWMENTYVPLTVAFLAPDGTIQEMQDMQPLTTDYHTPAQAYEYAIEANLGFFAKYGITVGDKVALQLT